MLKSLKKIVAFTLLASCSGKAEPDLKDKAGRANEFVNLKRYEDVREMMTESLRQKITKELFDNVDSTTKNSIGEFIKPIDTSESTMNGVTILAIRNQYQQGIRTTTFQFDESGKILHLYTIPTKN